MYMYFSILVFLVCWFFCVDDDAWLSLWRNKDIYIIIIIIIIIITSITLTFVSLQHRLASSPDNPHWVCWMLLHLTAIQGVTCHMGSHSVTCHLTQVNTPRL